MKLFSRSLLTSLVALSLSNNTLAQTDTDLLDLGRIQVRKEFTQHISIKSEDLEKFPAANLSEALNVWLYGTFTNKYSLVYVIDGNITTDVNVYSVYDIEEVTIVQNAMVTLNGVAQSAQMAYIKTIRNQPGTSGLTAAAQANFVEARLLHPADKKNEQNGLDNSSDFSFFHRYNVSAYKNTSRNKFGISGTYLRDVFPTIKGRDMDVVKDPSLARLNFNSYANTAVGKSSSLDLYINYAPQTIREEYNSFTTNIESNQTSKDKTGLLSSGLKFKNNFSGAFSNELNFEYGNYNRGDRSTFNTQVRDPYNLYSVNNSFSEQTANNFLFRDNLVYTRSFSGFSIAPSVNFSFRYRNQHSGDNVEHETFSNGEISSNRYSWSGSTLYSRTYLLTPSINFYYQDIFNIQGGLVFNMSESGGADIERRFPFVSSSLNVLKLIGGNSRTGLRVFGSYAQTGYFGDDVNLANDFFNPNFSNPEILGGFLSNPNLNAADGKHFESIQAGADLSLFDRLTMSYTYNERDYNLAILRLVYAIDYPFNPGGPSYIAIPSTATMKLHAVRISGNVRSNNKFSWNTSASVATIYHSIDEPVSGNEYIVADNTFIRLDDTRRKWSGGWANRLSIGNLTAELDLLAKFRGTIYNENNSSDVYNSVVLQNLSLGYRIPSSRFQGLEVYLNSRNLLANKKQNITDGRKYFGLGLKAAISR